jgi:Fic family protein
MLNIESITITSEILSLIAEIDEFKGSWRALGALAPERLASLRRVATIESIGSSTRIVGGYAKTMALIFESFNEMTLTENHIKQLHRDLLLYSYKDERHRGHYKTASNSVAAFDHKGKQIGIVFETATPFNTPRLMKELISWFRQEWENKKLHPLLIISIFAVVFLEIHPFQDGNGRLSRILTALLLLQAGYAYVPYSSLESIIEQNKENYYLALRQTQKTIRKSKPDWNPWILFFLRSLQKQVKRLEAKIEKEKMVVVELPEISLRILEHIKQHGRVTMTEMVKITGVSRNTLKTHFRMLTSRKLLTLQGSGRGAWYTLSV